MSELNSITALCSDAPSPALRPGRFTLPASIAEARVTVDGKDYVVRAGFLLPGREWISFTAWERSDYFGPHSTVTTIAGETYGAVRSFCPKGSFPVAELPVGSLERTAAVKAQRAAQDDRAVGAILAAHPWVTVFRRDYDVVVASSTIPGLEAP